MGQGDPVQNVRVFKEVKESKEDRVPAVYSLHTHGLNKFALSVVIFLLIGGFSHSRTHYEGRAIP